MKTSIINFLIICLLLLTSIFKISAQENSPTTATPNKLVVIWTSDDPNVAESVALLYTHAAKNNKWFDEVTLIIWGPSAKLISENTKLQGKLSKMQADGVVIEACIACANIFGVADKLKEGCKVLTF